MRGVLVLFVCLDLLAQALGAIQARITVDVVNIKSKSNCDIDWFGVGKCDMYVEGCLGRTAKFKQCDLGSNRKDTRHKSDDNSHHHPFYETWDISGPVPAPFYVSFGIWDSDVDSDDNIQNIIWTIYSAAPGTWLSLSADLSNSVTDLRFYVACNTYYYGYYCQTYCKATSTYSCNSDGSRYCANGYAPSQCTSLCPIGYRCASNTQVPCSAGVNYQDHQGQSSCKPVTTCKEGQFQASPPTSSSDRVCFFCNGATNYQDQAGQTSCKNVQTCPAGTRVTQKPSVSQNRECADCDGITEYSTSANVDSCSTVKNCGPGSYQTQSPSSTRDRSCQSCTLNTNYQDGTNKGVCKPVSTCDPGTRELTAPSLTSDRKCISCELGKTFSTSSNAAGCIAVTTCTDGVTFETVRPTLSSDRECAACLNCPNNKFEKQACTITSNTVCNGCSECEADEYITAECTSDKDTECATCKKCGAEEYESVLCQGETNTQCTSCRVCTDQEYETADCTRTSNRQCAPLLQCDPLTEFETRAPTKTSNRQCLELGNCKANEYESIPATETSDRTCGPLLVCQAGFFESLAPTATSNRQCQACPSGQYQDVSGQLFCKDISVCPAGETEKSAPTPTSNRVCEVCPEGQFKEAEGQGACVPITPCEPGFIISQNATTVADQVCSPCEPGTSQSLSNQHQCTPCGLGKYSEASNSTTCRIIQPGYFGSGGSPTRRTSVRRCFVGNKCSGGSFDQVACVDRQTYAHKPGMTECLTCRANCTLGYTMTSPCSPSANGVCQDITPPVVTMKGQAVMRLVKGSDFTDPGAEATDTTTPGVALNVVVQGEVLTDTASSTPYILTYTATDQSGLSTSVNRSVYVDLPTTTQAPGLANNNGGTPSASSSSSSSSAGAAAGGAVGGVLFLLLLIIIFFVWKRRQTQPEKESKPRGVPNPLYNVARGSDQWAPPGTPTAYGLMHANRDRAKPQVYEDSDALHNNYDSPADAIYNILDDEDRAANYLNVAEAPQDYARLATPTDDMYAHLEEDVVMVKDKPTAVYSHLKSEANMNPYELADNPRNQEEPTYSIPMEHDQQQQQQQSASTGYEQAQPESSYTQLTISRPQNGSSDTYNNLRGPAKATPSTIDNVYNIPLATDHDL
eukprot:m.24654 g.24654  ORF g.24654 m.24654 type:complete len:1139 (+) comp13424_c0_seq3:110-3526(+)